MKPLMIITFVLLAGCAGSQVDSVVGNHEKNGGAVRVERLGSLTTTASPIELQCSNRQVKWCVDGRTGESCSCLPAIVAEAKLNRMKEPVRITRSPNH